MPRGFLDPRPVFDNRANFALSTDEKRRACELAAEEGLPLSAFLRRAVMQAIAAPAKKSGAGRSTRAA